MSEYFAIFEDHGITVSKENQNEKKFIVNFSLQTANQLYTDNDKILFMLKVLISSHSFCTLDRGGQVDKQLFI